MIRDPPKCSASPIAQRAPTPAGAPAVAGDAAAGDPMTEEEVETLFGDIGSEPIDRETEVAEVEPMGDLLSIDGEPWSDNEVDIDRRDME